MRAGQLHRCARTGTKWGIDLDRGDHTAFASTAEVGSAVRVGESTSGHASPAAAGGLPVFPVLPADVPSLHAPPESAHRFASTPFVAPGVALVGGRWWRPGGAAPSRACLLRSVGSNATSSSRLFASARADALAAGSDGSPCVVVLSDASAAVRHGRKRLKAFVEDNPTSTSVVVTRCRSGVMRWNVSLRVASRILPARESRRSL